MFDTVGDVESQASLTSTQQRAVDAPAGVVVVRAPAGSGKTRVLTHRIAARADLDNADPRNTLAVTFTRRAAGELRQRVRRLGLDHDVAAGTLHAVALGLVRRWHLDHDKAIPKVLADPRRLLSTLPQAAKLDTSALERVISFRAARPIEISDVLQQLGLQHQLRPDDVALAEAAYVDAKVRRNALDFSDLVIRATQLLNTDNEFARATHWRFAHLLVDEAQDLTPAQLEFIDALAGDQPDLFLVGDPRQSIYGFAGAQPDHLHHPQQHWPNATVIDLAESHRLPADVSALAAAVLVGDDASLTPPRTRNDESSRLGVRAFNSSVEEAVDIAHALVDASAVGLRWSDMAVLTRTGADAQAIAQQLRDRSIPVHRASRGRLATDEAVVQWFQQQPADALVTRMLAELSFDADAGSLPTAFHDAALEATALEPELTIENFRNWLALADDLPDGNAVTCTTIHASKGLEWHLVVLAATDVSSRQRNATSDEEHRVMHVGMTRTRDQLVITWARNRDRTSSNTPRVLHPVLAALDLVDLDAPPVPAPDTVRAAIRAATSPDPRRSARRRRLEAWRDDQARIARVAPEAILPTRALEAIVRRDPDEPIDLLTDTGLGPVRAARLTQPLLALLADVS